MAKIKRFSAIFSILPFCLVLAGCRLEITSVEGGYVISDSGQYDCEEGAEIACTWDVQSAAFNEVFTAVASPGYKFVQWSSAESTVCGGSAGSCSLEMSRLPFTIRRSLLASNSVARLTPVFERTNETLKFSVSGVLGVLEGAVLDSDTNNPDNGLTPNDSVNQAQLIENPGTASGYLNEAGAGDVGNTQNSGDYEDFYKVDALAGDIVSLFAAEFIEADLDLYLYDESGAIVEFSNGTGEVEQLEIPEEGTWYINASLFSGASNYLITVGRSSAVQRSKDIVLGEVILQYKAEAALAPEAADGRREGVESKYSLRQMGGGFGRERLMRGQLRPSAYLDPLSVRLQEKRGSILNDTNRAAWDTFTLIKSLRKEPSVLFAEPNYKVKKSAITNDRFFNFLWHYELIKVPSAWDFTTGSSEVIAAVIDTGIIPQHPDIEGQLTDGYDFISDPDYSGDGDGIDSDPTDVGEGESPFRSGDFHGLHVSGTIAAKGNNSIGIVGVAYDSKIMPLRALNADGEGTTYDIMQAVRFAAGLPNDSNTLPAKPADVINLSLGGGGYINSDQIIFDQVAQKGILTVAASGNEGSSRVGYPAAYDNVFAVGAVDATNNVTTYSNRGNDLSLVAPGGDTGSDANGDGQPDGVLSTYYDNGQPEYIFLQGTSMATPHVAGIFALMKSVNAELNFNAIDSMLTQGALTDDLGPAGYDEQYGWGVINAQKAVIAAIEADGQEVNRPAALGISARSLSFGSSLSSATIIISNLGKGELNVTEVSVTEDWLLINPSNVDENGLGSWLVNIDRSDLPDGSYQGRIAIDSSAGSSEIAVAMRVSSASEGDVGTIYVLFVEADSQEVIAETKTSFDEDYAFLLPRLEQGRYEIWAGTDTDNDFYICDEGETCGAWQNTDSPAVLNLNSDRDDIDFTSDFQLKLPELSSSALKPVSGARPLKRKKRRP